MSDFSDMYPNSDIGFATAARLSATFPYVSPGTRAYAVDEAQQQTPQMLSPYHVVDGGYFDNYGVATIAEWLENPLLSLADELGVARILLIETRFGSAQESPDPQSGWMSTFLGPLSALYNVRGASAVG